MSASVMTRCRPPYQRRTVSHSKRTVLSSRTPMIVRAMCGTLKQFFIPALGALLLTACTPSDFHKPGPLQKEDVYNSLFPQWVELCAVSQISKKPGYGANIAGGPGGHAVLFLHGACLDPASSYPVLKSCPDGETGISMNSHFRNANWLVFRTGIFFITAF